MDHDLEKKLLYEAEAYGDDEDRRYCEIQREMELFDLCKNDVPEAEKEESNSDDILNTESTLSGIVFFNDWMHKFYNEDTLVWQPESDPFLSMIDPSVIKRYIKGGYLMREVHSRSQLIKYLIHTIFCTSDEDLQHKSFDTLSFLLTTCKSVGSIKMDLYLAFANLGADLSVLQIDISEYKSCVTLQLGSSPQPTQVTEARLHKVLSIVLEFLSLYLTVHEKYKDGHPQELIILLIAVGLDPKVINKALDSNIATCISHSLNLYATEEAFREGLQSLVEQVLQYCKGDTATVVYLCESYINQTHRGEILQRTLALHQLRIHLEMSNLEFIGNVEVKDVTELLSQYFERHGKVTNKYVSYYLMKLLDLCFCVDFLNQLENKHDLRTLWDLNKKISDTRLNSDDAYSVVFNLYRKHVMSKWSWALEIEDEGEKEVNFKVESEGSLEADKDNKNNTDLSESLDGLLDASRNPTPVI